MVSYKAALFSQACLWKTECSGFIFNKGGRHLVSIWTKPAKVKKKNMEGIFTAAKKKRGVNQVNEANVNGWRLISNV